MKNSSWVEESAPERSFSWGRDSSKSCLGAAGKQERTELWVSPWHMAASGFGSTEVLWCEEESSWKDLRLAQLKSIGIQASGASWNSLVTTTLGMKNCLIPLKQPRILWAILPSTRTCYWLISVCPPGPTDPFLQICFPDSHQSSVHGVIPH